MGAHSSHPHPSILVIEAPPGGKGAFALLNRCDAGWRRVERAGRLTDALVMMAQRRFDVVVLDLALPEGSGLSMLRKLRLHEPHAAVVALGDDLDGWAAARAIHEGAQACLARQDLNDTGLVRAVHVALQHRHERRALRQEAAALRQRAMQHHQALQAEARRGAAWRDLAGLAVFRTDARGRCAAIDGPWEALTGVAPGKAQGRAWLNVLPPAERRRLIRAWFGPRPVYEPFRTEHELTFADGSTRWIRIEGQPMHDGHGAFCGYAGAVSDCSALHAALAATHRRQQALENEQLARWRLEAELARQRRAGAETNPAPDAPPQRLQAARDHHRRRTRKLVERLRRVCEELASETRERKRAEALLAQLHDKLDAKVHQRTAELRRANRTLREEFEQLNGRHHDALRSLERRMNHALSHIEDSTGVLVDQLNRQWSESQTSLLHEVAALQDRMHDHQGVRRPEAGTSAAPLENADG